MGSSRDVGRREYPKQALSSRQGIPAKQGFTRKYLHARILEALQEAGTFLGWALLGGTDLRFLYSLPRYSEDLGFSTFGPLERKEFRAFLLALSRTLQAEGSRLEPTEWDRAVADVRPFLERHAEAALITPQNIQRLLLEP